jgi:hypothetical protein
MTVYSALISAEKSSLSELNTNYLVDIDTLEKICACSVAAKLNEEINPADGNLLIVDDVDGVDTSLLISSDTSLALSPTFIDVSDRIPVFDMIRSIRTITKN